jgi:thioester reductase-like protein
LDEPSAKPPSTKALPVEPARIFLTGATGFLGAFLLREILVQTRAHVVCLVRAENASAAVDRVIGSLRQLGLWSDSFQSRIEAIAGSLDVPRFGLGDDFHRLAETVDVIYNNGALLSFVASYGELKGSHVRGTREVLLLASTGRRKIVHHVSSVAVFDGAAYRGGTVTEFMRPIDSRGIHLPYAQCKWMSESLVWSAVDRGTPATVHRPSLIGGSSVTGAWNRGDLLCRLIKECIETRSLPGDLDIELDFSPVDYVSRSIVHLSLRPSSVGRAFHLQSPRPLRLEALGEILRSLGYEVEPLPYGAWIGRIERRPQGPLYPLLPFLARRWCPEGITYVELAQRTHRPRFACEDTRSALSDAGIECPSLEASLIRRYLDWLIATGQLSTPR